MGNITFPKLKSTTLPDIRSVEPPKLNSKSNTEIETQSISNDKEIKTIKLSDRYCIKIDKLINGKIIKEGDIITIIGKREMKKKLLLEIECKNKSYNVCANYWLKMIFKDKEHKNCFKCLVRSTKYAPITKRREYTFETIE